VWPFIWDHGEIPQSEGDDGWLLIMATDSGGVPDKLLPAVRIGVFWAALPFIGLLLGSEELRSGSYGWAAGWYGCAALSILVAVYWERLVPHRWRSRPSELQYLHNEDEDLGSAIKMMAWYSAWGKWYASQQLANSHRPNETDLMHVATFIVGKALVDGHVQARGRRSGQLVYEDIPPTHWRSTVPHMIPDNRSIWKMILIPTGGAEIGPHGTVIGRDPAATDRTAQLQEYDSIIVKARDFEKLWPRRDAKAEAARKHFLKKARKAGVDPAEIAKLRRD
jgi:hypothetical protein